MSDKDNGDLVSPDFRAARSRIKQPVDGRCKHGHVVIDPGSRVVACKDCGKRLDAFDVLLQYVRLKSRD